MKHRTIVMVHLRETLQLLFFDLFRNSHLFTFFHH